MARLNHPNVVTVHALGEWDGGRFIAMELVEGLTYDVWRTAAPRTPPAWCTATSSRRTCWWAPTAASPMPAATSSRSA
jgi:hypothetical protein